MEILSFLGICLILYINFLIVRGIYRAFKTAAHNRKMRVMNDWWSELSREEQRTLIRNLDDYRKEKHDFEEIFHPSGDGLESNRIGGVRQKAAEYVPILKSKK